MEELEIYYSALADSAVGETEHLKREIAHLEAQIPSDIASREIEKQIREQTGKSDILFVRQLCFDKIFSLEMFWKEKYSVLAEENTSVNDLIRVLEQVKFNVLCQKNLIKDVTTPSPGSHGALL